MSNHARTSVIQKAIAFALLVALALVALTLPTPRAADAAPGVQGTVPTLGFGILLATADSSPDALVDALAQDGCHAVTIGLFQGGAYSGYVPNAPAFVNAAFPESIAAGTAFVVRCFPVEPTAPAADLSAWPEYAVYEAHVGVCSWVLARLPQDAFASGAEADGRILFGNSHDSLGHGIFFLTAAEAEERGLSFDGTVPTGTVEGCEADQSTWTAEPMGEGLEVLKARLLDAQIWTSTLNLAEQFSGVELEESVRDALAHP